MMGIVELGAPGSIPEIDVELGHAKSIIWGFPKMVGFPNNIQQPWGFPTSNHHFGVFWHWGYHHLRKHLYTTNYISEFIHE